MEFRDYYKTLGVERTADEKTIREAFRKLARKYHPDVNKAKGAEDRFKEINEAYQVLGDAEKRARYDQMYEFQQHGGTDWASAFGGMPGGVRTGRARTFRVDLGGLGGFSDFFEQFFGDLGGEVQQARGGTWVDTAPPPEAPPLEISLEEAYHGVRKSVELQVNGVRERGEVTIPAGVRSGQRIRLGGTKERGEVTFAVQVRPHPLFERRDDDLYVDVPITLTEAMLGAEIEVPTLDGRVKMKIPPETQNGQQFRLRGQGMPRVRGKDRGDQIVRVKVVLPQRLSPRERELFEELGKSRQDNPRAKM
jgi:curved DNA-binding protein